MGYSTWANQGGIWAMGMSFNLESNSELVI